MLFSLRSKLRAQLEPVDQSIALLYIDDRGIEKLNEEYRTGEIYATITELLTRCGVEAIGYDIIFARRSSLHDPERFVEAVQQSGIVYPAYAFRLSDDSVWIPSSYSRSAALLDERTWHSAIISGGQPFLADTPFTPTLFELSAAAKSVGFINATPDRDGIHRRIPLLLRYNDGCIPSLTFAMVCDFLRVTPDKVTIDFGRSVTLHDAFLADGRRSSIVIPIDERGRMILNFPGGWGAYGAQFSVADLLDAAADEDRFSEFSQALEGSLVLVADISTGVADIGPIPSEANYPLPGLHLTVMNTILTANFLQNLDEWVGVGLSAFLLFVLISFSLRLQPLRFALAAIVLIVLYLILSAIFFVYGSLIVEIVRPISILFLSFGSILAYRYFAEEQEKRFIRRTFSSYFSPTILKKIEENPGLLALGGERKELTVLFSDIVGFTGWSSTQSPESIKLTLNEYFDSMAGVVFKYDGYIDKFMGDGMMVFFGDPIHQDDHPLRCVQAAIEMQANVRELRERWSTEGRLAIRIRIGVHTGEMTVGNMGSRTRMDYTVLVANVNLAQRLEANAPVDGILISDAVHERIKGNIATHPVGTINVKGLESGINVYEVAQNESTMSEGPTQGKN